MKIPFRKRKRPAEQETVEISTLEDVFTLISESKQRLKKSGPPDGFAVPEGRLPRPHDTTSDSGSVHESISTMATIDNNPGTGRVLDTYFYQPAGRATERFLAYLAFRLHLGRGGRVRVSVPPGSSDAHAEPDTVSISTTSTTSTATDNPGTGRIIDKYVYKVIGKMIERCAGRIVMSSFLKTQTILFRIYELWWNAELKEPCLVCKPPEEFLTDTERIRLVIARIEEAPSGSFILSGVREVLKRQR